MTFASFAGFLYQVSIWNLISTAGPIPTAVLSLLLLFSVWSWAIIFSKWNMLRQARTANLRFLRAFRKAPRRLSLPTSTLANWIKAAKAGKLGDVGKNYWPLTEVEMELARTKKELAVVKMERDILKKAAAYFARESLPGTR